MKAYLTISLILAVMAWITNSIVGATGGWLGRGFLVEVLSYFVVAAMINFVIAIIISFIKPY